MGDSEVPHDVGFAVVAKAAVKEKELLQKERKKARLKKEMEAARRKSLQSKRDLEESAKKKAREKNTVRAYFGASRNSEDRQTPVKLALGGSSDATSAAQVVAVTGEADQGGFLPLVSTDTIDRQDDAFASASENRVGEPGKVVVSIDSSGFGISEDDADCTLTLPAAPSDSEGDDDFVDPPTKRPKKSYDLARKFQMEWSAKLPWAEMVLANNGRLHMVRCRVCTDMGKKPHVMGPKWHTLLSHDGRTKHKKKMLLYASRRPTSVLEQVNQNNSLEAKRKRVQLATLFQVITDGRPMSDFCSKLGLYELLGVPDLPRVHWSIGAGWLMAEHMWDFVLVRFKEMILAANYIALTCDETTAIDNRSYMCVHIYVMFFWVRFPMLVHIQKLESDGGTSDNLLQVILTTLAMKGGLSEDLIAQKLLCFGADGAAAIQGARNGVSKKLHDDHAPFASAVHCWAHKLNLAFKALGNLDIMHAIEDLLKVAHSYFAYSPKKFAEFHSLAQTMETKGLKLLKNVPTRWVSLIEPLRRLLAEYRSVIAKMNVDAHNKKERKTTNWKAASLLSKLVDPYIPLGMTCLLPLMEAINILIQFAQKRDIFICDIVGALHHCQGQIYKMYKDGESAFKTDEFWSYKQLVACSHEQIHMQWVPLAVDLNDPVQQWHLAFCLGGENVFAKHEGSFVTREIFAALVHTVQAECAEAAQTLLDEMRARFPAHSVMDALGIVYPQYWLQGQSAEVSFRKHLDVIKDFFGEPRWIGEGEQRKLIPPVLDRFKLELEQPLFKVAMISNAHQAMEGPQDLNPLTKLWRHLDSNVNLAKAFAEYVKLAEIAMIHVLGSVEDERAFSALTFLKDKVRNKLDDHLPVVLGMHSQRVYTLGNFPYDKCFEQWVHSAERCRYGLTG